MEQKLEKVFSAGKLGTLELKNRIIMAPLLTRGAEKDYSVSQRLVDFYAERAKGGAGLIVVGHSIAWESGKLEQGLGLWDDRFIPGLKMLADAVHENGAKISIQLGGKGIGQDSGIEGVAPSPVAASWDPVPPRALRVDEIQGYVAAYAAAARRVQLAGFDAVTIHAAHGKLVSQFLSPYLNRRTDEYGGSVENRTRFLREIIAEIHKLCGDDFPIIVRMNGSDYLDGGITIEDAIEQAKILENTGIAAMEISGGTQEMFRYRGMAYMLPEGQHVSLAAEVKKHITKVPVITVGKLGNLFLAEQVLQEGKADFISLGRPLIADPYLPEKMKNGEFDSVRRCLYCLNCGTWSSRPHKKARGFACTINPDVLREEEFAEQMKPADVKKKIIVIGGGLAGLEASRTLAKRGHSVKLFEKDAVLGGQWNVAAAPAANGSYRTFVPMLEKEAREAGVEIVLNKTVTMDDIRQEQADEIVLATGANPRILQIDGSDIAPQTVTGNDILMKKVETGEKVVVIGGRYIGMEAAAELAEEGKQVVLVEGKVIGHGTNKKIFEPLLSRFLDAGGKFFDNAPVMRFVKDGVDIAKGGMMLHLQADTIVLAVGTVPNTELKEALEKEGMKYHEIGDCKKIGDALESISDGAEIGRML